MGVRRILLGLLVAVTACAGPVQPPVVAPTSLVLPLPSVTPASNTPCKALNLLATARKLAGEALNNEKLMFDGEFMKETRITVELLRKYPECESERNNLERGVFLCNRKRLEELIK